MLVTVNVWEENPRTFCPTRHFMISKTDVSNVFLKRYGHHPSTPRWFDKAVQEQESARP